MNNITIERHNQLLAQLPPQEINRLSSSLELLQVNQGQVLCEAGANLNYAYFPTTAVLALVGLTEEGASNEVASIGNEGVLGVNLFMGQPSLPNQAIVQASGWVYRFKRLAFKQEFNRCASLQALLLQYTQAFLTQLSQTSICGRHHSIEQRLCRWLLHSLDRMPGNELTVTQELIANMLGVRREGITEAAGRLQKSGIIQYSRGHIEILDRDCLEDHACECYFTVQDSLHRAYHQRSAA